MLTPGWATDEGTGGVRRGAGSMFRRYVMWREKHTTTDIRLHTLVTRVNVS
ncbi:hypothetical protein ACH4TE_12175 [Streptomyces sioyaensis]|uniref:hypothetical protein n=1 Tax=Streptomyces sioyaensis TaxID=67364 RepID=UPI0037B35256